MAAIIFLPASLALIIPNTTANHTVTYTNTQLTMVALNSIGNNENNRVIMYIHGTKIYLVIYLYTYDFL